MAARKSLILLIVVATALAGCSNHNEPQHASRATTDSSSASAASRAMAADAREAARAVTERFGKHMQEISVLAPPDVVRAELPEAYGGLLSPALLRTWQLHPEQIIGREGSSPWPDRIEIRQLDCTVSTCRVTGNVAYITSNEVAHGGVFMRRAITLELIHTTQGWRIAMVHLDPVRQ